jgi:hypothetical protein
VAQIRPSIKSTLVLKESSMIIFIVKTHAAKEHNKYTFITVMNFKPEQDNYMG